MQATDYTALEGERAAWLRRRLRLLSTGFLVTFGLLFALTEPELLGSPAIRTWLHLPQSIVLVAHWLWLQPLRSRRVVEWGTVVAWSLCLAWSSLWLVFAAAPAVPSYALGLLITVMFAAPVARLSWRTTAVVLGVAAGVVLVAALVCYQGPPPILFIKNALLAVPGVALVFDAASRDRLERAEFEARTRLAQALGSLKREEEARTRLLVNLSHDFRTPLAMIRGEAERLHARPHPADEAAALARIEANASALADLIEQLLELARLDAGKTPRSPIDFSIGALAAEVAAQLRPASGAITVAVAGSDPPATARADRAHVRRILFNLVANGVRQLRATGGEVLVRSAIEGTWVVVDVIDDGAGIPAERRGSIFERFTSFDADGSTTSGIGLPLARELAELNGGTLELCDGPVRTTFRLRLPSGEEAGSVAEPFAPVTGPGAPAHAAPADHPPRDPRPRLLVVEDHEEMRGLLSRILGDRFDVRAVATVEEGLAALDDQPPRAVVSDVLLGERTGYDLLAAMRRRPALDGIPVVLVSALADAEQRVRGLTAGADDYLAKPFSIDELRARVSAAVDRADARRVALSAQRDALLMELHDGVNAALARAAILLASRRSDDDPRAAAQAAVLEALEESAALLSVLEAVHPPWEELCAEIRRRLAEDCEGHALELCFTARSDGSCAHLRPAAGHALKRIAREALTNVIKHAGARAVTVMIEAVEGSVHLRIEDDGAGLPVGGVPGRGLGIIARRAEQQGGSATSGNHAPRGAFVDARLTG
ncbi:MAG: response regulator [Myxococcales bacterium]|nr:response regulator [Myxococcales bacterium]